MKRLIVILFLFAAFSASATNWYINTSTGSDGNIGSGIGVPFKTIAKMNSVWASVVAGDSILFNRGDVFYGSLIIGKSGTSLLPIIIGAYGTGAKPLISGFTNISSWTAAGGNIWISTPAITPKYNVNLVTVNGQPVEVGRYPNAGKWLSYESYSTNVSITDNQLSGASGYVNGHIIIRKEGYIIERDSVTSISGTTVNYRKLLSINPRNDTSYSATPGANGFGYFFCNSANTLDTLNEWYWDKAAPKLIIYNPSTPTNVRISTVDTLLNIGSFNNITIDGIQFEGANLASIYFQDANTITIKNCDILNGGAKGIFGWNTPTTVINNCTVRDCLCSGIDVTGRYASGVTITNNTVNNTAIFASMGNRFDEADMCGIYGSVYTNLTITGNAVVNSGFNAIRFQGNSVLVKNNLTDTFCFVKDDGGGIYTYEGQFGAKATNSRAIIDNVILHAIGAPGGNAFPTHAEGIYLDGGARGVFISGNTIAYGLGNGIYMNDSKNVTVSNNNIFSNGGTQSNNGSSGVAFQAHCPDTTINLRVTNNIVYSATAAGRSTYFFNYGSDRTALPAAGTQNSIISNFATLDSNYYNTTTTNSFVSGYYDVCGGSYVAPSGRSFSSWQALQDAHSVATTYTSQQFEYATGTSKTVNFAGLSKKDLRGNIYNNSVTLAPYTSIILIDNGTVTPTTNFNTVRLRIVN